MRDRKDADHRHSIVQGGNDGKNERRAILIPLSRLPNAASGSNETIAPPLSADSRTASVISRQQRDVNRSPDPVLKITAIASLNTFDSPGTFSPDAAQMRFGRHYTGPPEWPWN